MPNYEDIEQQPPVPKPRSKNSIEDDIIHLSVSSRDSQLALRSSSGYENVSSKVTMAPDYEDIEMNEDEQCAYETPQFLSGENRQNSGDRILFLNEDDYADPNGDSNRVYRDQVLSPQPSNYEVPVNLISSPVPPQRTLNAHSPLQGGAKDIPPPPPPRHRERRVRRDSSIHGSLIDLGKRSVYCMN